MCHKQRYLGTDYRRTALNRTLQTKGTIIIYGSSKSVGRVYVQDFNDHSSSSSLSESKESFGFDSRPKLLRLLGKLCLAHPFSWNVIQHPHHSADWSLQTLWSWLIVAAVPWCLEIHGGVMWVPFFDSHRKTVFSHRAEGASCYLGYQQVQILPLAHEGEDCTIHFYCNVACK